MKKKIMMGCRMKLFLFLVFCGIILFQVYILKMLQSTQYYLKRGRVYGEKPITTGVARIYGITEEIGRSEDGKTAIHLVDTDAGIVFLEVKDGDKDLSLLLEKAKELISNPRYIVVKEIPDKQGIIRDFLSRSNMSNEEKAGILTHEYLSMYRIKEDLKIVKILAAAFGIFNLIFLLFLIIRIRKNRKAYEQIFEAYPELQYESDLLKRNAAYYNDKVGLAIYKNHLLVFAYGFDVFAGENIERMRYFLERIHHGLVSTRRYYFEIVEGGKKKRVKFKAARKKEMDGMMDEFFTVLRERFPNIMF